MEKITQLKWIVFALILFQSHVMLGQTQVPFTKRFDKQLKGDMLLIGNNNMSEHITRDYTGTKDNNAYKMVEVDIDTDPTTSNSSSATLSIPNAACYKIEHAGLYWGALFQGTNRSDIEKVKLKLPGSSSYINITGTKLFDASTTPISKVQPYSFYADITSQVSALANPEGEYTVANIKASLGYGGASGWSIFIVYSDPTLPAKFITSFDGFSAIIGNHNLDIPINGFTTVPSGPVRVKFAFSSLEGDRDSKGDYLRINNTTISAVNAFGQTIRPKDNFFNSSVTFIHPQTGMADDFTNRRPASINTLGYDAGVLDIDNPRNSVIGNSATSAIIKLATRSDAYFYYFNAFAIDIIEPKIALTKLVKDAAGQDIGGQGVTLGQYLYYDIGFENKGNDDATSFTIRDELPDNVIFDYPRDIISLPPGVTEKYDAATRNITFTVDKSLVTKQSGLRSVIKFRVQVSPDCNSYVNACSNSIDNLAFGTYRGVVNNTLISDDPSVNSLAACVLTSFPTNFLALTGTCNYNQNVLLCGTDIDLTAGSGYSSYTWYSDAALTKQIGTGQIFKVRNPGTYYVKNVITSPCSSTITQSFVVARPGGVVTNPVSAFEDTHVKCPNDGKELPQIILCGANAYRDIKINLAGTTSVSWEKLDEASCNTSNPYCANESSSCTWNTVANGDTYRANAAGQYRVKLDYAGCYSIFYFNVYTNLLNPTETHRDIICGAPGNITIGGVSGGYVYSIDGVNYQSGNSFSINTPGSYTAYIKQSNAPTNACIFMVPGIVISKANINVVINQVASLCPGGKGKLEIAVNGVYPQYYYELMDPTGKLINSSGPTTQPNYVFDNLDPSSYWVKVSTDDGCIENQYPTVPGNYGNRLTASAALIEPLTPCSNAGKIKVTATGGTAPYNYSIDGGVTFQNSDEIDITVAGVYNIEVVDKNNCSVSTSITVTDNPKPIYTVTNTDNICYSSNSAEIKINVTNANGYTMSYSIDNGVTFQNTPVFPNLAAGTYDVVVRYTITYTPVPGQPALKKYCEDTTQVVIAGPTSGITASGGVAELAGCTLGGLGGKLKISNVKGGTAPYQYSFDGGISWQATSEKDVMPGDYTLIVKDNLGCEYMIPYTVTLDPKPADPTITVSAPAFDCYGKGKTTVTVTNNSSANFSYEYYLDGVANTPIDNNIFTNVPSGNHTITVDYKVAKVSTYSILLKEDFGSGVNTTTAGIASTYCYHDLGKTPPPCAGTKTTLEDAQYVVTKAIIPNNSAWYEFRDHTSSGSDVNGRFLAINVGKAAGAYGVLYKEPIVDIIPNQPIKIDLFVANLLKKGASGEPPILRFELEDAAGNVVATEDTGKIAEGRYDTDRDKWVAIPTISLNPGMNTDLNFVIRSGSIEEKGNDLAIDDISVYQIPKACSTSMDFPFDVPTDKAFKAEVTVFKDTSCSGASDGSVTISAENFDLFYGFDYSIDNGTTWVNNKVSPVVINGLSAGNYNIQVRYDASATSCIIPIPQQISSPPVLTTTASVTTPATCTQGATITATANGGTQAYEFELRDTAGNTVVNFQSSNIFTNVSPGVYTVVTRDQNACTSNASAQVTVLAPVALKASLSASSNLCYTPTNPAILEVDVITGTAPYTFSLNGAPAQNSEKFTNIIPGTYTILVTDSNNCTDTLNIIIAAEIKASAVISKTLDCTSTPDAIIKVDIAGGTAPFTYKVKKGAGSYGSSIGVTAASFDYTAATADTYTFQITDVNGCITVVTTTIDALVSPTVSATKIDALCNGSATGSVQLTGALGAGGYTYLFYESTSPVPANFTPQSNYTGLAAGTYNYQVKDSKDCTSALGSITIDEPTALVASATATAFKCDPSNVKQAATVTIAVPTTGTAPYQYSFNGGAFTPTRTLTVIDNGTDQTISYQVRDSKGCTTAAQSLTINKLDSPTDITLTYNAITCTDLTTTVRAQAVNGVGTITYEITSPAAFATSNTTGVFPGLVPGTYNFRATDANGCYFDVAHTIKNVTPITVAGNKTSDVLCNGGNTGSAQYTVGGFAVSYRYSVNGAAALTGQTASVIDLTNLPAGSYTVEVTDETTNCTATATVVINEPKVLSATYNAVKANCFVKTAAVTVTVTGGTPVYGYSFVENNQPAGTFGSSHTANLDPTKNTEWDVYIKDAYNCILKLDITIGADVVPSVTASAAGQCLGVGSYTITATPGAGLVAPLAYSINKGASYQATNTFVVTTPGSYTIRIKDGNGCTEDSNVVVVYETLTLSASLIKDITCYTPVGAQVKLLEKGGNGPFTYSSIPATGAFSANIFSTDVPGSYIFTVTDANGCTVTTTSAVVVTAPVNPVITSISAVDVLCNGDSSGSITVDIDRSKGLAPFVYTIFNTTTGVDYGQQTSGLPAGDYKVTVTDAKGCKDSKDIRINEPTAITMKYRTEPITCGAGGTGKSEGKIIIDYVRGGSPNYTYHVKGNGYSKEYPNQTGGNAVFNLVDYGFYEIIITDANGCQLLEQKVFIASPPDHLDIYISSTADCLTGGSAEIAVGSNSGLIGQGPFYFAIYTGPNMPAPPVSPWFPEDAPGSGKATITGLTPGVTYTFIAYDSLSGCTVISRATTPIPTKSSLITSALVAKNVTCTGSANGNVSFDIVSIYPTQTPVSYEIFDALTLASMGSGTGIVPANGTLSVSNFGSLPLGKYYVVVKETTGASNAGCSVATPAFDITESAILFSVTASVSKKANCFSNSGIITAIGHDGTAPYTYQLLLATDPAPTAASAGWASVNTFNRDANTYTVYAKDAYDCIKEFTITLGKDAEPTINDPALICYDGTPFPITITGYVDPAVGGATYSAGGSAFQASPDFTFNAAGSYILAIKDGNGCIATTTYVVQEQLFLKATLTKELDCTATPDAEITLSVTGGDNTSYAYEYSINGGVSYSPMTTNILTTRALGDYIFKVTDAQGCTAYANFRLDDTVPPVFTTVHTNVSCYGGTDGTITVTVSSGTGLYEYQLDGGAFQSSNVFTGVAAGLHKIKVRDGKSCTKDADVMITEPNILNATATVTQLACGAGNVPVKAVVTITAAGGTAPYEYSFDNGLNYSSLDTYESYVGTTLNVVVRDAKGCTYALPTAIDIPALNPPVISSASGTRIKCGPAGIVASTVTIAVSPLTGVGPLGYEIMSPASETSNTSGATSGIFTSLPANTYIFRVTDKNGCTDEITYTVDALVNITITGQLVSDVLCNGGSDGAIKFNVDNFEGTVYTQRLIRGVGNIVKNGKELTLNNLSAGIYEVEVTDVLTNCTAVATVTVSEPTLLGVAISSNINATCNTGAKISVTASGGTPNYQYAFVLTGATPVAADYSSSFNAVLDPASGLNWTAYVKDAHDCVSHIDFTIATDPLPGNISAAVTSHCPSLTGEYTFTVTVGSGVAPYQYSIGKGFQASPIFTVNAPGSYDVTVRDANGCEFKAQAVAIIHPVLELEAVISTLPTCIVTDGGSITATAKGGSSANNYSYTITGRAPITTTPAVFNNLTAGSYTVTVEDTNTHCTVDVQVVISDPTPITGFALAKTDVTCNGGTDGSITASLAPSAPGVNDNPVYKYSLTGTTVSGKTVTRPDQTSPVFDTLEAGSYTVTVTSGRACQDSITIQVTEPALIVVPAPVVVQYACNTGSNASNYATVTAAGVTGGSGVYTYEFIRNGSSVYKGPQNVYIESDYKGGTYEVNITDDKGCTGSTTTTAIIDPFISLDVINIATVPITCTTDEQITITVGTTGGTPVSLEYKVEEVVNNSYSQTNTTGIFTGLKIGNYLITVTNPVTKCSIKQNYYVSDPNTFVIKANVIAKEICFGSKDGIVELTFVDNQPNPSDDAGPFDYRITDGTTTISGTATSAGPIRITNLSAGQYTVTATLTNSPWCAVNTVFTIKEPSTALVLSASTSAITCIPGNDGEIAAAAKGGWGAPYQYELVLNGAIVVPYSTNGNFTALSAGVYTVNAKDSHGCVVRETATLVIPAPIVFTATANTTMLTCFGDKTAVITAGTPTGGQGSNYLYTLNMVSVNPVIISGPQSSPVFSGLGKGTYSITVTDGFNCSATSLDIVIAEPGEVTTKLVLSTPQTCLNPSELTLSATGGTGPYTYSADGISYNPVTFISSVTFPVSTGKHQYYVKDAYGCVAVISNEISIYPLEPLVVNLDVTNATVKCLGESTGVIVAKATGGLGNYNYTLKDGTGAIVKPSQTHGRFENLAIGSYFVEVNSIDCDATSGRVDITQPATAVQATFVPTDVTCFGENDGKIVVNAAGGTGIIKYAISPQLNRFVYTNTFEKLTAGTYTVIAQDENGCYVSSDVVVNQPLPLIGATVPGSVIPELCKDDKNGAFSIEITGGTGPYEVSLDNEKGPYIKGAIGQTVFDFKGINGGTHTVYIIDDHNCSSIAVENMPLAIVLDPIVTVSYECVNNAQANRVEVTIDESNMDPTLIKYDLDGNPSTLQSSNIFTNVAPGYHIITAIHDNGCYQFSKQFSVASYEPLTLALAATKEMNILEVAAKGGAPEYQYSFNGEPFTSSNKYKIYKSGDYQVVVRDQNGCEATITVPGQYVDVCLDDYFTPNGDGVYDGWGPGCTNIYTNLEFSVMDRSGRILQKFHYGEEWDGTYNGVELPSGDYWYVLKLNDVKDNREFIGHFSLYR